MIAIAAGAAVAPVVTPPPGIYPDVSFSEYSRWHAAHYSILKYFDQSPAHVREEMLHPSEPTAAFAFGHALHVAVLEPQRFEFQYAVAPDVDRRTKVGRAEWADFEAAHPKHQLMKVEEWECCLRIRDSIARNKGAAELLGAPGANEVSILWQDETGQPAKARQDSIRSFLGHTWIVDLKSARDASPRAFAKDVANYGYHSQAAMYLDGLQALQPVSEGQRRFVHVVAEKQRPWAVALYELDDETLAEGRRRWRRHMDLYAHCEETGTWPSYPEGAVPLRIPRWAFEREDSE